jgi:hypothetical protein
LFLIKACIFQAEIELLFAFVIQIRSEALLRRLDLTALRTLCSTALEFQEWDADSIVFSQGDVSTCCYVILTGSISIWIKTPVSVPSADTSGDHSDSAVFESEKDIEEAAIMTDADEIKLQSTLVGQTLHGRALRLTLGDCVRCKESLQCHQYILIELFVADRSNDGQRRALFIR